MANSLNNNTRGEFPQNRNKSGTSKSFTNEDAREKKESAFDKAAYVAAMAGKGMAEKINTNLFPNLSADEHRLALIESCINTNAIFDDDIRDPASKSSKNIGDYMFYNQLYFMATAQLTQPGETGGLLPGLVGGLSMIAGAAFVSKDFRNNLKEHAEDSLLKFIEPFKETAPKLWHTIAAKVESHPGCVSPESIAIKLLRYQRQSAELVDKGEISSKFANSLLLKKTSELKQAAESMNIEWDDVIEMHSNLNRDLNNLDADRRFKYGDDFSHDACGEMDAKAEGLSIKTGGAKPWEPTEDWATPLDSQSLADKLIVYQHQLQDAIEDLHNKNDGDDINPKFAHLSGKSEDEYLASAIKEVAELKSYTEKVLGLDWNEVTDRYDELNKKDYDKWSKTTSTFEEYVDAPNRNKLNHDGTRNQHYGELNETYRQKREEIANAMRVAKSAGKYYEGESLPHCPSVTDYEEARSGIKEHNTFMYYELPVDTDSAGRCLKKYQQDAYENVRDISSRHNIKHSPMDSGNAYQTANSLCRQVRAASSILGFDWNKSIIEYRKDVFKTVLKDPSKSVIWKEIADKDIIANIPDHTITYIPQPNGPAEKQVRRLSYKERIDMWDGTLFDSSGNKLPDDSLVQVRNPYTEQEAMSAYLGLFKKTLDLQLTKTNLENVSSKTGKDVKKEIDAIDSKMTDIQSKYDDLNNSLLDDRFPVETLDKIRDTATAFLNKQRDKYVDESVRRNSGIKPTVTLDEKLSPHDADESDYPSLEDHSFKL